MHLRIRGGRGDGDGGGIGLPQVQGVVGGTAAGGDGHGTGLLGRRQLHRAGAGDGVVRAVGPGRYGDGIRGDGQRVVRRGRDKVQRLGSALRRDGEAAEGGGALQYDGVGLDAGVTIGVVLGLQREGAALHAGVQRLCQRRGSAVPAAAGAGAIHAVRAHIDGAQAGVGGRVRAGGGVQAQIGAAHRIRHKARQGAGGGILRAGQRRAAVQDPELTEPLPCR